MGTNAFAQALAWICWTDTFTRTTAVGLGGQWTWASYSSPFGPDGSTSTYHVDGTKIINSPDNFDSDTYTLSPALNSLDGIVSFEFTTAASINTFNQPYVGIEFALGGYSYNQEITLYIWQDSTNTWYIGDWYSFVKKQSVTINPSTTYIIKGLFHEDGRMAYKVWDKTTSEPDWMLSADLTLETGFVADPNVWVDLNFAQTITSIDNIQFCTASLGFPTTAYAQASFSITTTTPTANANAQITTTTPNSAVLSYTNWETITPPFIDHFTRTTNRTLGAPQYLPTSQSATDYVDGSKIVVGPGADNTYHLKVTPFGNHGRVEIRFNLNTSVSNFSPIVTDPFGTLNRIWSLKVIGTDTYEVYATYAWPGFGSQFAIASRSTTGGLIFGSILGIPTIPTTWVVGISWDSAGTFHTAFTSTSPSVGSYTRDSFFVQSLSGATDITLEWKSPDTGNFYLDDFVIDTSFYSFGQAQAKIATTKKSAQSQARIKVLGNQKFAQAQVKIILPVRIFGQAQAQIAPAHFVFAQAQAQITLNWGIAAALTDVKQTYPNPLLSPGSATIRPTSDAIKSGVIQYSSGTTGWNLVDEVVLDTGDWYQVDDDNGYLFNGFEKPPIAGYTVTSVEIHANISNGAPAEQGHIQVRNPNTGLTYNAITVSQNGAQSQGTTLSTRPWDGAAWTQADIETIQVGSKPISTVGGFENLKIFQLWLVVNYIYIQASNPFAQATLRVKVEGINKPVQAQADILATSNVFAQAQSRIIYTRFQFASAQTYINFEISSLPFIDEFNRTTAYGLGSKYFLWNPATSTADHPTVSTTHLDGTEVVIPTTAVNDGYYVGSLQFPHSAIISIDIKFTDAFGEAISLPNSGLNPGKLLISHGNGILLFSEGSNTTFLTLFDSSITYRFVATLLANNTATLEIRNAADDSVFSTLTYSGISTTDTGVGYVQLNFSSADGVFTTINRIEIDEIVGRGFSQANSRIITFDVPHFAQAQTLLNDRFGLANAQCSITQNRAIIRVVAQATAWISTRVSGVGQAQAKIGSQVFAQANALIDRTIRYAQAQALIRKIHWQWAQAQALVGDTFQFAQARAYIFINTASVHLAFALVNADIVDYYLGRGQARCFIDKPFRSAQAQCFIYQPRAGKLVQYNEYGLPGYLQKEAFSSNERLYISPPPNGFEEYLGRDNKSFEISMLVVDETYQAAKEQVITAATMLWSNRSGYSKLIVIHAERYYLARTQSVKLDQAAGTKEKAAGYDVVFDCLPWSYGQVHTLAGIDTDDIGRNYSNGTWTPATIILTGTDITVSGYTPSGEFTGFISISGYVENLTLDNTDLSTVVTNGDYALFVAPGRTLFDINGATQHTIQYQDRWEL